MSREIKTDLVQRQLSVHIRGEDPICEADSLKLGDRIRLRKKRDAERERRKYLQDPEYRRKQRESHAKRYKKDPVYREKCLARKRRSYERNKERNNARRREWTKNNKERQLQNQREYYARNKSDQRDKIISNRKRRDPWRGLYKALDQFKRGDIDLNEFTRLCEERAIMVDEIVERSTGTLEGQSESVSHPRPGPSPGSFRMRKADHLSDENET